MQIILFFLHFGYPKTDPNQTAYIWIGSVRIFFKIIIRIEPHVIFILVRMIFCLRTDPNRTANTPRSLMNLKYLE